MKYEIVQSDITVVGGGLAGVCAALAAARLGQTVSLVQNRPVLGGNSSSEVRVWVCGATSHGIQRYARESGIMGELFVENQFRNPDGNPYYWDSVVLETVRAESNIRLFLNTDVHEVEANGEPDRRTIHSVTGWMMGSERKIRFESEVYLDCSGDGLIGFLAGAAYRIGREAHKEFHEDWAPEVSDTITLGSTILFYTQDVGHPVKYVPPSYAKDITTTSISEKRIIRTGQHGCFYWWIEWGGELDTVHDNERIRDELWAVIYGIWDYIKNSGTFEADHLTLEWVGAVPGKREYRRFVGDYILNQNDILAQEPFDDRIAFGGWSIDLHPPKGMYASEGASKHVYSDGIYHIPFRSLYSKNVSNLLFAGRNISASHIAFGTTRVMATCAVMGEAAGVGAALCVQKGVYPRELHASHMAEMQQIMLRTDASIIGLRNRDPKDQALQAQASASSHLQQVSLERSTEVRRLDQAFGLLLPVDPNLQGLELLMDVQAPTVLHAELWTTGRKENYVPFALIDRYEIAVQPGERQWVKADARWFPEEPQNAFLILQPNENLRLHLSDQSLTGVLLFVRMEDHNPDRKQPLLEWSMRDLIPSEDRKNRNWRTGCITLCMRMSAASQAYEPLKVIDGFNRPYGGPHLWISNPIGEREEWIELQWEQPIAAAEIHLTFNDDLNEDLINLHHHKTKFDSMPELVKDYRIETLDDCGEWVCVHRETENRKRKRVHRLNRAVATSRLRLVVESTNGSPYAEVVEIRVYSD
ncbi:FAD-dependent oxidoreductase [Paenibacillus koleovorans]|uniref:FAD-dependent oxidoreductase n=1 Tax=Paenibacillus koleovorans TaxID=121608 RepID=UPI000FD8659F|nr:FAD-dependent oxidoreductase [Paenibacillus koleovorans]